MSRVATLFCASIDIRMMKDYVAAVLVGGHGKLSGKAHGDRRE
jgi:hypothetical protein